MHGAMSMWWMCTAWPLFADRIVHLTLACCASTFAHHSGETNKVFPLILVRK